MCKYILVIILFVSLSSCVNQDDTASDDIEIQESNPGDITILGDSGVLEGRWLSACSPVDGTHYDVVLISFVGRHFISNIENYEDAACTIPLSYSPNPTAEGTFTIGNVIRANGGGDVTEVETNITRFNGAPFIVNEYDIFYIDGDNLYFGDVSGVEDASSSELRPNAIHFSRVFIRQ